MIATLERRPTLRTPRLVLRPLVADDAARIEQLAGDYEIARMTTTIPHPFPAGAADAFIARIQRGDPQEEAVFAVTAPEEGFMGVLGFHPKGGAAPEVGYWLGRPYWGRGFMTEAARAALDWARAAWGRRFVLSGHFSDNPASGAVLCKAGFLYTGAVELRHSEARGEITPTRMMVWLA